MKILKKKKSFFYVFLFLLGIIGSYHYIEEKKITLSNQAIIDFIFKNSFDHKNIFKKIENANISKNKVLSLLNKDYDEVIEENNYSKKDPIIYLYNSHPTEEYAYSTFGEYTLTPTVIINNYIMQDIFDKNGLYSYVEERSVKNVLEENNWNYASSYRASRIFMEEAIVQKPSLKYFIDIHRDSIDKDKTSITIENRDFAKILFIVGLENDNYEENLEFTERIQKKLDEYYPGLCKGIYKKEGPGVNGVYNQDFSSRTILVEMGGYQNTTTEVLNSSIAFSRCMMEVIHEEGY